MQNSKQEKEEQHNHLKIKNVRDGLEQCCKCNLEPSVS